MWIQREIKLKPYSRGFHLITNEILEKVPELKKLSVGMMSIFIKHTSASLTINENADPTVREDFECFFSRTVPENQPYYKHLDEGSDDIPAHIKGSILGFNLSLPITNGNLNIGIWQGIYLCEHRNKGGSRNIIVTINGKK